MNENGDHHRWSERALDGAGEPETEEHVEACADCRGLDEVWRELGRLESGAPSERMRRRFESALVDAGSIATIVGMRRWPRWGSFAAGLTAGLLLLPALLFLGANRDHRVDELAAEVSTLRAQMMRAGLDSDSAAARVATLSTIGLDLERAQSRAAVLGALRSDPSVHVRLAALDALARSGGASREELREALLSEDDPLVQVALVERMLVGGLAARRDLESWLGASDNVDPTVAELIRGASS